ncbi:MAG TPA: hypothetical protein VHB21_22035 [Minicystis sp.]|nr:hypothetical protein [Minicystis sp.]
MKTTLLLSCLSVASLVTALAPDAAAQAKVAADPATPAAAAPAPPPAAKVAAPSSDPTVEIAFDGYGSWLSFDNTLHNVGGGEPTPLKHANMRMLGKGWMPGGELRIAIMPRDRFGRLRLGFGVGIGGLTGFDAASNPLAQGVSFRANALWGARFEGFLGQEFAIGRVSDALAPGRKAWLYPYVDMMAVGTITQANVDLHVSGLGKVGTSTWDAYAFSLAPRAGVAIPLTDSVSLDGGGYYGVYGAEKYGFYAGLSVVVP